ncbi:hypothetical protein LIER_08013 [Lithospermum erythrorhizon]|uniref:Uncharacterized protein n=1 Tax=Lithospermum erythrorhizon TaxID=34254 RepID=A0AAV3PAN0_LITER
MLCFTNVFAYYGIIFLTSEISSGQRQCRSSLTVSENVQDAMAYAELNKRNERTRLLEYCLPTKRRETLKFPLMLFSSPEQGGVRVATKRLPQLRHLMYQFNHLAIFLNYSQAAPSK